jgi:hypothetical protein
MLRSALEFDVALGCLASRRACLAAAASLYRSKAIARLTSSLVRPGFLSAANPAGANANPANNTGKYLFMCVLTHTVHVHS